MRFEPDRSQPVPPRCGGRQASPHGAERAHLALAAASTRIRKHGAGAGRAASGAGRAMASPQPQAGRTLLQHARIMLEQAERDCGRTSAPMPAGSPARCGCCPTPMRSPNSCPEALSAFLATHPNVSVDHRGAPERRDRRPSIAEGVGDIVSSPVRSMPGRLTTYPFRSDRFVAGGGARPSAGGKNPRLASPRCSTRTSSPRPGERHPALPRQQGHRHRPAR